MSRGTDNMGPVLLYCTAALNRSDIGAVVAVAAEIQYTPAGRSHVL